MRCPICRGPLKAVAGAPDTLACARCDRGYSGFTARQSDVLKAIRALTKQGGAPPSSQAIGDKLGISRQAAKKHLDELERLGLIRDEPVMIRSGKWRVLE